MPSSYSIGAIGSDPYFQNYLLAQQNYYAQPDATRVAQIQAYQQALNANPTESATQIMTYQQASPRYKKEESHTGRNLLIAAGAATLIYACYKGKNGNPIDGAKTIWNELKGAWNTVVGKEATKGSTQIKEILGKDIQEYTVKKEGVEFLMKDGNVAQIITADKKVITDAAKVAEWVDNNAAAKDLIRNLDVSSGTLPKGVSLSYTKEIADGANAYKMIVENGKVVKALSKDKAGNFIEVAEKDFEAFIRNHGAQVKEAETLTKTSSLNRVRLLNSSGVLEDAGTQNVTWSVRNGKVVSANIGGRTLKPEEIKALQKDFGAEIKLFGKEAAGTYKDINSFEYIYRTSKKDAADIGVAAGQRIRFNPNETGHTGTNWITGVNNIEKNTLVSEADIKAYLDNHADFSTALDQIASNGTFANGFRLDNFIAKTNSGNILTFDGNKKLTQIKLPDGTIISGKKDIDNWLKVAANANELKAIKA